MPKNVDIYKIHKIDARNIDSIIPENLLDVTVTSPPYFDMKDYGYKEQIGFGQNYEEYLNDLFTVFSKVYNCTKEDGTLWVIIDAFRKNGAVVPLPFDFAEKIKGIGWKLQEIIIWGKDRTVPWAHHGQMRSSFEYVLMFSKSKNYKFFIDKVRDFSALKKWWVKYPERYNPKGKTPDAIWNFEIPTQGSWGKGYIKHFCPLPEEMIAQILKLTTNEGDVVFDPFSGTGAVLSKADNMMRKYIGTELNPEYIKMFKNYLKETGEVKRGEYILEEKNLIPINDFESIILDLRALKLGRLLFQKIQDTFPNIEFLYVKPISIKPSKAHSLIVVEYSILITQIDSVDIVKKLAEELCSIAPLSKYGIEAKVDIFTSIEKYTREVLPSRKIYVYTKKISHTYKKVINSTELSTLAKTETILSEISVCLNEKDYE
ncbi:DNA-methyltransferase [Pedobacter sp. AW1-32]|uniref:DNA-methyltransferase n=1 Tax=Pedobacter sp. AW1-32 TaxID=3383026 RepID=UPI003FEFBAF4